MNDDADSGGDLTAEVKQSKRTMFKDALAKTKNKFKKDDKSKEFALSQDVNDFLAAGKTTQHPDDVLPSGPSPNLSSMQLPRLQQSSRGFPMPRLDVSQSTRFPAARPVEAEALDASQDFLRPDGQARGRSLSFGSMNKRRNKPRNLSVSFDNRPPVVIGVGGDDAQQPPSEISRFKLQAMSLQSSTHLRPSSSHSHSSQGSVSSTRRKPVPLHAPAAILEDLPHPKPLQRVQTGMETLWNPADKEFEMSLGMLPEKAGVENHGLYKTSVISPKPIHPPTAPPRVQSPHTSVPPTLASQPHLQQLPMTRPSREEPSQVVMANDHLVDKEPTLPNIVPLPTNPQPRRQPNAVPVMPHHKIVHRQRPSLNETETMSQGAGGWL